MAQPSEEQSSPEQPTPFPAVGDIISTDHFDEGIGIVLESDYPYGVAAAAIKILEDGSEKLGLPGTVHAELIDGIEGHWDIERIVNAWAKTWESAGSEMAPENRAHFRDELMGRIALGTKRLPKE